MNISELKTPIRIYWDLAPPGPGPDLPGIAGQIVALKILSVDVTATSAAPDSPVPAVLDRLATGRIAVSLTLPGTAISQEIISLLAPYRLRQLSAGLDCIARAAGVDGILRQAREAGVPLGVSFAVTRANFREIPLVVAFCVERGMPLVLPMQRLEEGDTCFRMDPAERRELTERLKEIPGRDAMRVTIHDPFLWRAFYPEVDFPNGRCQAANTMLSIAANGEVYPCPTLPVTLGNLAGTTLAEIVLSTGKREVRERILRTPAGCASCAELAQCLGGCRGRGLFDTGSWEEPDPGCGY